MDPAFSGGSDQFSGARLHLETTFSADFGRSWLGEDSSGSSTNRNLENGPEVDMVDILKSKQQQARAPSMIWSCPLEWKMLRTKSANTMADRASLRHLKEVKEVDRRLSAEATRLVVHQAKVLLNHDEQ